jgi:hypothetical protein
MMLAGLNRLIELSMSTTVGRTLVEHPLERRERLVASFRIELRVKIRFSESGFLRDRRG